MYYKIKKGSTKIIYIIKSNRTKKKIIEMRKRYVNSSFLKFVLENNKEKLKELELEFNEDELSKKEKNEDEVQNNEDEVKDDIQEEDPDIIKELKEYFKKIRRKK